MQDAPADPSNSPPSLSYETPPAPRSRLPALVAWLAIWACVANTVYTVQRQGEARAAARQKLADGGGAEGGPTAYQTNPGLRISVKYAAGLRVIPGPSAGQAVDALAEQAKTPAERVALVPLTAEARGKEAALSALDAAVPDSARQTPAGDPSAAARDADALRRIYTAGPDALPDADRRRLVDRLEFAGELALVHGKPDDDPARRRLLDGAIATAVVMLGITLLALPAGLAGLALLILVGVWMSNRKFRLRYSDGPATPADPPSPPGTPPPLPLFSTAYAQAGPPALAYSPYAPPLPPQPDIGPPYRLGPLGDANGRTGPFIEAFAIYLAGYVGLGLLIRWIDLRQGGMGLRLLLTAVPVALALVWPRLRGMTWADVRRGFGWTAPRGVFREMGAGVAGYVAGLPLFAGALAVVYLLTKVSGAVPTHPINDEVGRGGVWGNLLLFALAAVWAPVVEETLFRGALFHRLRAGWNWAVSAVVSSLIFAAVHPQGWTTIPALAALAIVFCGIREWRGSTLAGMTAHGLHNGVLVTLMIVAMG